VTSVTDAAGNETSAPVLAAGVGSLAFESISFLQDPDCPMSPSRIILHSPLLTNAPIFRAPALRPRGLRPELRHGSTRTVRLIVALALALLAIVARPAHATTPRLRSTQESLRPSARRGDNSAGAVQKSAAAGRTPNELGRIPIVEWHQVVDADGNYKVSRERFKAELKELHDRGYVPISLAEYLDKKIDLPAGKSPVLFTFDDASPSQFRYLDRGGKLVVDPTSAVGILLDFIKANPDWKAKGLFCALPAAQAGHAFFGDKGIDGQLSAWRFLKLKFLVEQGFELCNHTLWHAQLNKYSDGVVQEQLARGALAIDSAVPGYVVRGMALPYGIWPKNKALAYAGSWHDAKGKRDVRYKNEAVFEVAGGPARSPYDPQFNAKALPRVPLQGGTKLTPTLDAMDKPGPMARYVSDGNPAVVAKPAP
jgi:peptidoglycan/xylan/chitin deacetylase (PgdA/CDA1 family)